MKRRCYSDNEASYQYYKARGIVVCKDWLSDYGQFESWALASGYKDELTLDRINNDGNYEPSNCRWVDMKQQNRNKGGVKPVLYQGEYKPLSEWSEIKGLNYYTVYNRVYRGGWSVERALETQVRAKTARLT